MSFLPVLQPYPRPQSILYPTLVYSCSLKSNWLQPFSWALQPFKRILIPLSPGTSSSNVSLTKPTHLFFNHSIFCQPAPTLKSVSVQTTPMVPPFKSLTALAVMTRNGSSVPMASFRSTTVPSAWMSPKVSLPMVINFKSGIARPRAITKSSTIQSLGTISMFFFWKFYWLIQHSPTIYPSVYDGTGASVST